MDNAELKFVADVMLGGLAKWLRLLGCDVYYNNMGEDSALLARALKEHLILLTRDNELANRAKSNGYLVREEGTFNQLNEIIEKFDIDVDIYGDRCPVCNGKIVDIEREEVKNDVPTYTYLTHSEFRKCLECGRVFWSGSHRDKAARILESILGEIDENK